MRCERKNQYTESHIIRCEWKNRFRGPRCQMQIVVTIQRVMLRGAIGGVLRESHGEVPTLRCEYNVHFNERISVFGVYEQQRR